MRRRFVSRAIPSGARINALQLRGKRLRASAGSFLLSGSSADLRIATGHFLAAGAGAFLLSGQNSALLKSKLLSAAPASFALTGRSAGFVLGKGLIADAGAFALSGSDAGLLHSYSVAASAGAFALVGQAAGLLQSRLISAEPGTFALSGQDAAFLTGKALAAHSGAFALTGQDAGLLVGRRVAADAGAFALTGQAATLTKSADVEYRSFNRQNATQSSYTFNSVDIGTAAADRYIILCLFFSGGATGAGKTVVCNGVTLTSLGGAAGAGIYSGLVPTGTSVTVTVTSGGSSDTCGIAVYAAYGLQDAGAVSDIQTSTSTAASVTLNTNVPAGGIVVASRKSNSTTSATWAAVTENFDSTAVSVTYTGASIEVPAGNAALGVQCTFTGTATAPGFVSASFR